MATERPRVLQIIDTLGVGGTELGLARIVERTKEQFDHTVLCIRDGGATAAQLNDKLVPVLALHKPPGTQWTLPLRIAGICRRVRPHIVHTRNWGTTDAVIGARLARVPVLIHGEHGFGIGDVTGAHRHRRWLRRILSAGIDRFVAVSEHLRNLLIDEIGIPPAKVTLIRSGIDLTRFRPRPTCPALRQRLGFAPDDFVIGSVGRLDPVKNYPALIDALATVTTSLPGARLVLAGGGPDEERLRQILTSAGLQEQINLLGHQDNIPELLNIMDVFVLPSLAEGTCNAILEAMAAALPVIATRVAGNPELVLDGRTGWLVPPRDADALADRIHFYASNPEVRRQHGHAGRAHVQAHYSAEQMTSAYADLYCGELARRASAAR